MEILFAAGAMFAFVFLKAFQQRNVAGSNFLPVVPTSLLMAVAEVYVISVIVRTGFDPALVLGIGAGSGAGAMSAMYLHDRVFGRLRT
jgi:hypothetical protein